MYSGKQDPISFCVFRVIRVLPVVNGDISTKMSENLYRIAVRNRYSTAPAAGQAPPKYLTINSPSSFSNCTVLYEQLSAEIIVLQKKFFSLQYKVFLFSLILIAIPLLIVGTVSYIKSAEIIQKKVSQSNLNTVRQIAANIELILQDVHNTSLHLFQNDQIRTFLKLSENAPYKEIQKYNIKAQESLMYLLCSKKYIHSIYIKGFNGITIDTKGILYQIDKHIEKKILELKGGYLWITDKLVNSNYTTTDVFSLKRVINDIDNITARLATLSINIDEKQISNIYKDKIIGEKGDFFIIDRHSRIISALNKGKLGEEIQEQLRPDEINKKKDGYYRIKMGNQDFLITYCNIDNAGWTLINIVPIEELLKEIAVIKQVTLIGILVSFIICIMVALIFTIKVLSPIKQVRKLMGKLEKEDFNVSMDLNGNDEIALLGRSFNKMSGRLRELIREVYQGQLKQKEAELIAIQAQINPHFLYNTLDTIYWMARIEKAFETSSLVGALSKLFRLSLNKGNKFTTVKNEVEHLKNYIIIQQKRYEDMIDFSFHVPDEVLDCKVIKLVLQPLVENAIYHGIEKKGEAGKIDISIAKKNDRLLYTITDDGNGVDEKEINGLLKKVGNNNRGFGIKNVNDRIKLCFGEDYGLRFHSSRDMGTRVIVTQPYIKENDKNDRSIDS